MTQEEKHTSLVDLCARLPYGVIMTNIELPETYYPLTCGDLHDAMFDDDWDDVPYLRPMSSMTEEEMKEYEEVLETLLWTEELDFYNKHHFDYRGLIPMGLAIEAPKDMYGTKQ